MNDLIKAFQIFAKYTDDDHPTMCEHDIMYVNVEADIVTNEDVTLLEQLYFYVDEDNNNFYSTRFGSC